MSVDDAPKIKVFASDDNLKALGELLSNDSSRGIIYNLMTKEMYTNEIATKLDMRVSLVIHHLKKLEDLGLLEITEKKIKRKGQEHRFFQIKSNIFVVIDNTAEEIKEKGLLKRIFGEGVRFTMIGIIALSTYFFNQSPKIIYDTKTRIPESLDMSFNYDALVVPLLVIISGLVFELILSKKKKRLETPA